MIPVTKPFLPPAEDYEQYLNGIWQRNWLTNNGPLVNELEIKLKGFLKLKHLLYVSNGTIALQLAIKALELKGEIITTPFSYVATTSSISWESCHPIFVDIDPETWNIDPGKIEQAITPQTSAILATHVYGNPCDIEAISRLANKHNLKVIYDAAHAFGVTYKGHSIFTYGDISTTSFHATKLFHTVEGGAIFTKDPKLLKRLARMRNFGHSGIAEFDGIGINGKNSEFHAAMGLVNLPYAGQIIAKRKLIHTWYEEALKPLRVTRPKLPYPGEYNFAYYPILFEKEAMLLNAVHALEGNNVFPRRYFYPLLSTLNYVGEFNLPIAEGLAKRVLCLPIYHQISKEEVDFVARILLRTQNYG